MKSIFDKVSQDCSKSVTNSYSTSFSLATKMLSKSIRQDIYNIYGFVRFADEIVDTLHDYNKKELLNRFIDELNYSLKNKISTNPILNSFQSTVNKYKIDYKLIDSFLKSMKMDLKKVKYNNENEYKEYIYGSADVVGLMCLKVFLKGNEKSFKKLKPNAMALGSAFQKVNFLRDLKADFETLERTYFPDTNLADLDEGSKAKIIREIEEDFEKGLSGIVRLPVEAKFGVYTAYRYYSRLLAKLKNTEPKEIKNTRIRVPNYEKFGLLAQSYVNFKLQLV